MAHLARSRIKDHHTFMFLPDLLIEEPYRILGMLVRLFA